MELIQKAGDVFVSKEAMSINATNSLGAHAQQDMDLIPAEIVSEDAVNEEADLDIGAMEFLPKEVLRKSSKSNSVFKDIKPKQMKPYEKRLEEIHELEEFREDIQLEEIITGEEFSTKRLKVKSLSSLSDEEDLFCDVGADHSQIEEEPFNKGTVKTEEIYNIIDTDDIELLNAVCESVFANWSPGNTELKERESVMDELAHYIRRTWPSSRLTLYGSSRNGFSFKNSDLDISLTFDDYKSSGNLDEVWIIKTLAKYLKNVMRNVSYVTRTKVPIVKLVHPRAHVEVDISLYNELGSENSRMLHLYATIDPRVTKLGYMAKLLAKTCSIGDASQGSLSSYAHILMMIFYLQQVSPPVLPVLQEMYPEGTNKPKRIVGGWNAWFFSPDDEHQMSSSWDGFQMNKMSVGQLWLGFLHFYANKFDSERFVVSIRQHEPLSKQEKKWSSTSLAVEDPFELNHNLGGTSQEMNSYIKKTFSKARKLFGTPLKVNLSEWQDIQEYFFNPELLTDGPPPGLKCGSCGSKDHWAAKCPQVICKNCGENGHMATDCEETLQENELKSTFVSACKNGNPWNFYQIFQLKELNINCRQGEGLYWAVRNNHIPIWKTLLDQPDIRVNFTDRDGNTVLHWSCFLNLSKLTEKLLSFTFEKMGEYSIKCNLKNNFGNTALMEAADNGSVASLRTMLACPQVDVFIKRKGGKDFEDILVRKINNMSLDSYALDNDTKMHQDSRNTMSGILYLIREEKTKRKIKVQINEYEMNGPQNVENNDQIGKVTFDDTYESERDIDHKHEGFPSLEKDKSRKEDVQIQGNWTSKQLNPETKQTKKTKKKSLWKPLQ